MQQPTIDDAHVLIGLAQLGAGDRELLAWIWSEGFIPEYQQFVETYPPTSPEYAKARWILAHYETIAVFWKHKLINEELLFDWLWVPGIWDQIRSFVYGMRETFGEPRLGENLEAMATAYVNYSSRSRMNSRDTPGHSEPA